MVQGAEGSRVRILGSSPPFRKGGMVGFDYVIYCKIYLNLMAKEGK